ncbi:MAG: DNA-binding domain-containing protein [Nannocystaceae bacterium]|nr:DNA-binding domain-containing protein [Nannocystaceae bacterium]
MTTSLARLQALFWRAITHPSGIAAFLRDADDATREAFAEAFAGTPQFDARARMEVYADAYFWRLHDVLLDHFGLLAQLLGRDRFRNLATDYVLACPSTDPDIRRFGARLPGFVAGHPEAARVPGLETLAAIEWAMVRALDAEHAHAPASRARLAQVPLPQWPALQLRLVDSASLVDTTLPFLALWQQHDRDAIAAGPLPVPATQPRHTIVIWRERLSVMHRGCDDDDEAAALRQLGEGCSFEALCERHGAQPVVLWMQRWLDDALVCVAG